ncbi:ras-related protein Rab-5A isoform X2 [Meriones unguiculatus]|uniref:ras-related protein Rab-5A isoform X2 n=1 Tax=Meriones unguiculatus TaxID=10047 RepID=UPI00293E086A|nr:ras-related protein Rab-5A isoform X2 [Meriones unguiculatus]XP_060225642.1 ras-related protein Rab-5A isoform X2 [Meriones unguiculatus]
MTAQREGASGRADQQGEEARSRWPRSRGSGPAPWEAPGRPLGGAAAEVTARRASRRAATWRSRRKQFPRWPRSVCVLVREGARRCEGRRRRGRRTRRRKKSDLERGDCVGGAREQSGERRRSPAGAARRSEGRADRCEERRAAAAAAHPISGPRVASLPGAAPQPILCCMCTHPLHDAED